MYSVDSSVISKLIEIVKKNSGEVYDQPNYINFFGVRDHIYNNNFNDTLYIFWKDTTSGNFVGCKSKGFTTKPGPTHVLNLRGCCKKEGVAIMLEGWQKDIWAIGTHQTDYQALVSKCAPCPTKLTRDNTQFGTTKDLNKVVLKIHGTVYSEYAGLNLHKPAKGVKVAPAENGYSLGCQVFQYAEDFEEMMVMARAAKAAGQKTFSYFLISKDDFLGSGVVDTSPNVPYNFNNSQVAGMYGAGMYGGGFSGEAYRGCDGVYKLGDFTSSPDMTITPQETQKREEVLETLIGASYTPDVIKKCVELITVDKIKNEKPKSDEL